DLVAWKKEHSKHKDDFNAINGPAGVGKLYVHVKGGLVAKFDARGGPPFTFKDSDHTADPTPAGTFTLGAAHRHTTSSWTNSQIPWGAKIRRVGTGAARHFEYQEPGDTEWIPATGPKSKLHDLDDSDFLDDKGKPL